MTEKRKQQLEEEISYFRQQFEPINQNIQLPHSLTAQALRYRLQNEPAPAAPARRRPTWRWKLASAVVCLLLVVLVFPLGRSLGMGQQMLSTSPDTAAAQPMEASLAEAPAEEASDNEATKPMPQAGEGAQESDEENAEEESVPVEDGGEVAVEEETVVPNTAMVSEPRSVRKAAGLTAFSSQEELMQQVNALLPQNRSESADEVVVEESADALPETSVTEEAVEEAEVVEEEAPVEESAPRPLLGAVAPESNAAVPALEVGMTLWAGEQASVQEGVLALDDQGTVSWQSTTGQASWQLESQAIQVTCVAADQFVLVGKPYQDSAWGVVTQVQWYRMDSGEATLLVTLEQQGSFSELAQTQEGSVLLVTNQALSGENGEEQLLPHYRVDGESVTLSAQKISYAAQSGTEPNYLLAVRLDQSGVQDAQAVLGALDMSWQSGELVVLFSDGSQETLSL